MEAKKKTSNKFSPEVRTQAVRMVEEHQGDHDSQWAAIASIWAKIGCTGEMLRKWVRQAECNAGAHPGATTDERERIKALERIEVQLAPQVTLEPHQIERFSAFMRERITTGETTFRKGCLRSIVDAIERWTTGSSASMAQRPASNRPSSPENKSARVFAVLYGNGAP